MLSNQPLLTREIRNFKGFFIFRYVQGLSWFWHKAIEIISNFEATFAVRLMLKHITEPIFQDYTRAGRILGILIRLLRIVVGLLFYLAIIILFSVLATVWAILPILAIWQVFKGISI